MNIYYIELENFKSFRGKHKIGPFTQMTGIIGPNGCGKSNIVDALTFVFHIENARNNHPISSISQQNRADFCSVEVVLSEKRSKISLKKIQTRKKVITFYLNNNVITHEDYFEQLRKYNIGPQSFMLQGETDKLIKKSPEELSDIIEKACGSIEFKNEYDQTIEKIKQINDETINIISEQKNLRKEDQKLKSISEQNEKYESLNHEIKINEVKIEQANFFQIDRSILEEMRALSRNQKKLDERKNEEAVFQKKIQSNNIKIKELQKNLKNEQSKRDELKDQIRKLAAELEAEEESLNNAKSFQQNVQLQKNLSNQIKEINEQIEKYQGQLMKEESVLTMLQSQESQKSKFENKKIKDNYEEYQELVRVCNSQTSNLELELKKLGNDLKNANSQLKVALETQYKQNNNIDDLESKINDAKTNQISKQGELTKKQEDNEEIKQSLKELEKARKENIHKIEVIQKDLSILLQNKLALEYELEQMEEIRNQNKVYRELHKFKGFYGQLSELIKNSANKSYDLSIKIALGSMLNCLVVDTPQTASLVNVTLASQGLSRDVMILQNLPQYGDDGLVKARLGNLGEIIASLVDVDDRSSKYEENADLRRKISETLRYLLRGKVVCDTNEKAFQLRSRKIQEIYQIITKDGDIISSGSIQISSSDKERYSKKDLGTEQNIQNLEKKITNEDKQIEKKMADLDLLKNSDVEKKYNKLIETLQSNESGMELIKIVQTFLIQSNYFQDHNDFILQKQIKKEMTGLTEKVKKLEEKKQQIRNVVSKSLEVINLEKIVKEIEQKLGNVQQTIDKKREEIYSDFCKKHKIDMKELVSQNAEAVERIFKNIEKQQLKVQDINHSINALKEKLSSIEKAAEKYKENLKKYEVQSEQFQAFSEKIKNTQKEKDTQYKAILNQCSSIQKEIQEINEQNEQYYEQLISQPNLLRKEIIQIKHSIGQLVDKKETLWQECQLKQIDFLEGNKKSKKRKNQMSDINEDSEGEEQISLSNSQYSFDNLSQDDKDEISKLSKQFKKSMQQHTQTLSQLDDKKLQESLNKFSELEMLNYSILFADRSQFVKKKNARKQQQQVMEDENDTNNILNTLLESVDIQSLLNYQNQLVDVLEDLRKKIEEYASKDLAEGLIGTSITTEEMKNKKDSFKNRLSELAQNKKKAEEDLKNIKKLRKDKFDDFFKEVQNQVKIYYGELTKLKGKHQGQKGNADLTVSNEDEKYKGGINYFCCPPKKSYALNPEKELSGGEKTLAQMALFLSIAKDSPFLILDESEAALDSQNTSNVIETLKNLTQKQQKLIVSHNVEVYSQCESLIGATYNRATDTSFILSLNLK